MNLPLSGRTALITGANQGLGRAIAERFVAAGASVLIVARGEALLHEVAQRLTASATAPGQRVVAMPCDVAVDAQCRAAVARAQREFGRLTALVNNAGVYGPMGALEEVDGAAWREAVAINLFGVMSMCQAAIPLLRTAGYGKIINLSGGGATAPLPFISAYAASKAAVVRLTETLAEELKAARVDVNAIAPGALNTRMLDEVLAAGPAKVSAGFHERARKQQAAGGTPPEKGAELAEFLASAASDGITGRLLSAVWDHWQRLPERAGELAGSDIYTLRRIVAKDRGKDWDA